MNFGEILLSVLLAVAGGAAGAAVINGINERWKFKANRKAVKEDRAEAKADKTDELSKTLADLQGQLKVLKTSDTAQAEALRLIRAWGFRYKTVAFVWLKRNRKSPSWFYGMGYWTRSNAEICLLATKGKPKRQSAGVHQFIISPIEQHSKKPDEARDKILALMGDLPRVELFARQKTPGWDAWGNEIASDITLAERS